MSCKTAEIADGDHTTENRGVPGSSPGLAIAGNPLCRLGFRQRSDLALARSRGGCERICERRRRASACPRSSGAMDGAESITNALPDAVLDVIVEPGASPGSRTARRAPGCCSSSRRSTGGSRAVAPHERRPRPSPLPASARLGPDHGDRHGDEEVRPREDERAPGVYRRGAGYAFTCRVRGQQHWGPRRRSTRRAVASARRTPTATAAG